MLVSILYEVTDVAVYQAISPVAQVEPVIVTAYRVETVRDCARICLLDHGRLVASATFNQLCEESRECRKLALMGKRP